MDRTCDKCNANIPQGNPYICLTHNIEYMKTDVITLQRTVSVVESEEVMILCANCGNRTTKVAIKQMIKAIPMSRKTVISN